MVQKITGEAPFQVLATNFSISPSLQNYVLQISADGTNYSDLFTVSAGQTKMVTNVANGSYYRMKNNASEVSINWRTQCNDGQGGGGGSYVLPPATEQTLGGIKVGSGLTVQADGTLSAEGGAGGVLVVDSLSSQEAASAPVGSLIGQYKGEEPYWAFMPTTDSDVNASTILVKGDIDFSNARVQINLLNSNYYFEVGRSNGKWTKLNKGNIAGSWKLDGVDIGSSVTGEYDGNVLKLYDGDGTVWSVTFTKQENGDWLGEIAGGVNAHYKCITNLTGINAFKYETISPIEANLYMKVLGGTVAYWQGFVSSDQQEPFEIIYDDYEDFASFADGKILLSFKYRWGSTYRYIAVDKDEQAIILYSDSALTTEVTRAEYLGSEVQFVSADYNFYYIAVTWKEDEITFRASDTVIMENPIDFHIEGVHFVRITDPTKATAQNLGLGNTFDYGIPEWNNEGLIVRKRVAYKNKQLQFNYGSSQWSNNAVIMVESGENNIPSRMYVPTAGGNAGQILVSNGIDAAPTFQNWIKSVKITSAAYEALVQAGTTDPSTLYLIDDNV